MTFKLVICVTCGIMGLNVIDLVNKKKVVLNNVKLIFYCHKLIQQKQFICVYWIPPGIFSRGLL